MDRPVQPPLRRRDRTAEIRLPAAAAAGIGSIRLSQPLYLPGCRTTDKPRQLYRRVGCHRRRQSRDKTFMGYILIAPSILYILIALPIFRINEPEPVLFQRQDGSFVSIIFDT